MFEQVRTVLLLFINFRERPFTFKKKMLKITIRFLDILFAVRLVIWKNYESNNLFLQLRV